MSYNDKVIFCKSCGSKLLFIKIYFAVKETKDLQEKFDIAQSEKKKLVADITALESECDTLKNAHQRSDSENEMQRKCKFLKVFVLIML